MTATTQVSCMQVYASMLNRVKPADHACVAHHRSAGCVQACKHAAAFISVIYQAYIPCDCNLGLLLASKTCLIRRCP